MKEFEDKLYPFLDCPDCGDDGDTHVRQQPGQGEIPHQLHLWFRQRGFLLLPDLPDEAHPAQSLPQQAGEGVS